MSFAMVTGLAIHCMDCGDIVFAELQNAPQFLQVGDFAALEMQSDSKKYNCPPGWLHLEDGCICGSCAKKNYGQDVFDFSARLLDWLGLQSQDGDVSGEAEQAILQVFIDSINGYMENVDPAIEDADFINTVLDDRDRGNPKRVEKLVKNHIRANSDNYLQKMRDSVDESAIQKIIDDYYQWAAAFNEEHKNQITEIEESTKTANVFLNEFLPAERVEVNPYIHTPFTGAALGSNFVKADGSQYRAYQVLEVQPIADATLGHNPPNPDKAWERCPYILNPIQMYRKKLLATVNGILAEHKQA